MKQYLDLVKYVLKNGEIKADRTGTGTKSIFGWQLRFNLEDGFPLVTTKQVAYPLIIKELLWFLSGSTNIRPLVLDGVKIWNDWPYAKYAKSAEYQEETLDEFVDKIKNDEAFANKYGDLGPVYGKQWRDFFGVDQISEVIERIRKEPDSRRLLVVAYNPAQTENMALPPCHSFFQFYVSDEGKKLSLQLYQRSADIFLGVPFIIASYALLLEMVAKVTGLQAKEFVHTLGDAHIYLDHLSQMETQLTREPYSLPRLLINKETDDIFSFKYEDFAIVDYRHHPKLMGKVSV